PDPKPALAQTPYDDVHDRVDRIGSLVDSRSDDRAGSRSDDRGDSRGDDRLDDLIDDRADDRAHDRAHDRADDLVHDVVDGWARDRTRVDDTPLPRPEPARRRPEPEPTREPAAWTPASVLDPGTPVPDDDPEPGALAADGLLG